MSAKLDAYGAFCCSGASPTHQKHLGLGVHKLVWPYVSVDSKLAVSCLHAHQLHVASTHDEYKRQLDIHNCSYLHLNNGWNAVV